MGKPSAPDPRETARAQTDSNLATATANANINRVDQYTPLGSSTYTVDGTNPDGTPKYSQTTEMSAPIKGIFDSQVANQQHQQDISSNLLGNVGSQYSKPIDTSGVNQLNAGLSADQLDRLSSRYATTAGPAQAAQAATSEVATAKAASAQATSAQAAQANTGNYVTTAGNGGGDIQRGLGIDSVPQYIKGAQDAAYTNQMGYLTPQFKNDSNDLNAKLAAQGITQGSAAWDRAQSELSRNQTFQQQQAQNSAFEQGLKGGQTAFGIVQGAGNFANSAQQQGYEQVHGNADLTNHAADVTTQNNQFNAGQLGQTSQFNAGTATQNSQFNAGQLGQTSQFNAGLTTQNNQFNAGLATQNSQFNAGQANQQSQHNAGLNNSAVSSEFGNAMTNAGVNNAAHGQGMTDTFATFNQPMNTYNQLQSGAQAQQPTFAGVPGVSMARTDVEGIVNNGYANQVGAYNGTMQGLGQLGAAAGMMFMSDRRLKENISKVGETPAGNNLYSYNYKGDGKPQVGVMAQELRKKQPGAVVKTPSGFLAVDYAKVK